MAERARHLVDHQLDGKHALRTAEAAERRVGHGVGLAAEAVQRDVRQPVRVVAVEDRAIVDRAGEIGGKAAARGEREIEAEDAPVVIEADVVDIGERVALAGGAHVVVAIEAQLGRAARLARDDRRDARVERHLRFLAAEAAAHSPALDDDVVRRDAQRVRDHVLHFARMLRRRVDLHAAALARHRQRDLPFEIEVILAAGSSRCRAADAARAPAPPRRRRA